VNVHRFQAMGCEIVVAGAAPAAVAAVFEEWEAAFSLFRAESELSRVNGSRGSVVAVSPLFARALAVALEVAAETDGLVDPTLGAELRDAGYDRTFALVRDRDGWHVTRRGPARRIRPRVELFADPPGVRIPPGVELDLGATAKALAADRAATRIARVLGTGALVSLGGDVAVAGEPPTGGWGILVSDRHDDELDGPGPRLAITGGGVATSSTVGRRWQTDAGDAHHLLDPRTGAPAVSPWRTISVAAPTCVAANVAATAGIVLGDAAPCWLEGRGLPARLVSRRGFVRTLGGWPADEEAIAC